MASSRFAICRFCEKLAMFILAIVVYSVMVQSEYPCSWLVEDGFIPFPLLDPDRSCMVLGLSPLDHQIPVTGGAREIIPSGTQKANCGFGEDRPVYQLNFTTSSITRQQPSVRFGGDWHHFQTQFIDAGSAVACCLMLQGALLVTKQGCRMLPHWCRPEWANEMEKPRAVMAMSLCEVACSCIAYFFYIPLLSQKSEDDQIWIRIPAYHGLALPWLAFGTACLVIAGACGACGSLVWEGGSRLTFFCFEICGNCGICCLGFTLLCVVPALVVDFRTSFSFIVNFDFNFEFSLSIYLEALKLLTWIAVVTDLAACLAFLVWLYRRKSVSLPNGSV